MDVDLFPYPAMTSLPLSSRIRSTLASRGGHTVVEAAGGQWRLAGAQMLRCADSLFTSLKPYAGRPLIAYLHKSPLYYAFTACSLLHGLDFCPLDLDNPLARVLDIASQLPAALIICDDDDTFAQLRHRTPDCLKIGSLLENAVPSQETEEEAPGSPDASYYIATSGSTGMPKLVQVPHRRTLPFIDWAVPFYAVDRSTRWAQFSSIGFDLSLVDFLTVICGGGTLVSLCTQMDRIRPAKTVSRCKITHWHSVPSMIPYFLREPVENNSVSACRLFTFCGEPLMKIDADRLAERYPYARIINTYGPTEATLFCSFYEYEPGETADNGEASLPVGQPIPSWNFVLVPEDGDLRLIVLSDNISTGYAGIQSPQFATVELFGRQMRAFDTRDYFRMAGPHLYFSHRKDAMVKIRGNRIDLGEIEAAAKRCGLVNPVAMVIDNAISIAAEGNPGAATDIMTKLARRLPRTNLPTRIKFLPSHPRTVNGKLDRVAIREAFGDLP